jgi:hypothetical protein
LLSGEAISLSAAEKEPADGDVPFRTDGKLNQFHPTSAERRCDEIGWADSLTAAQDSSADSGYSILSFTISGRINVYSAWR